MLFLGMCIALCVLGVMLGVFGGYMFGGQYGFLVGMMSGIMPLLSIMMIIGKAKQKGFLKLFRDLRKKKNPKTGIIEQEKFVHFPGKFGGLRTLIGVIKQPGRLSIEGVGDFDDKGDEFAWGNDPASFGLLNVDITLDLKEALYAQSLEQDGIFGYDNALKKFFGPKYNWFKREYKSNPKPDTFNIERELNAIVSEPAPSDTLERKVLGETVSFKNFCVWLMYAFSPVSLTNAIMQEKIITRKEALDYRDKEGKYVGIGKMVVYILLGLVIFVAVVASMGPQLSKALGGFF